MSSFTRSRSRSKQAGSETLLLIYCRYCYTVQSFLHKDSFVNFKNNLNRKILSENTGNENLDMHAACFWDNQTFLGVIFKA